MVDIVATLLAVDRDELAYAITTRTNYINNEKFIVPLNTREAEVSWICFFFFFFGLKGRTPCHRAGTSVCMHSQPHSSPLTAASPRRAPPLAGEP